METAHSYGLPVSVGKESRLELSGSSAQSWNQEANQACVQSPLPSSFWCWPTSDPCFLAADAQLLENHTSQYPQSSVAWLFYRSSHFQSVLRRTRWLCQTHPHINSKSPGVAFHPIPRFVCPQGRVFYEVESPGVGILGPSWNLPTTGRNQSTCHSNLPPCKGH